MNLTLLCIDSEAVILVPYQVRDKLQRESSPKNTGFPRIKYGAGSVKPGMTNKAKAFLNHYTSNEKHVKTVVLIPTFNEAKNTEAFIS